MLPDILTIDQQSVRIIRACNGRLSKMLKMPTIIDDKAVKIIAASSLNKGGPCKVWLNGKETDLKNLHLVVKVEEVPR